MFRRPLPQLWAVLSVPVSLSDGTQRRFIKTLDVREYKPLGTPMEFKYYQRFTNHPNRQSGVQFLTHFNTHQRFQVRGNYIDYMNWGRENGDARLPHRHQRVAFDFYDKLHPTKGTFDSDLFPAMQQQQASSHPSMDGEYDPKKLIFSQPEHWNKLFSKRKPGEGKINVRPFESASRLVDMSGYTDLLDRDAFGVDNKPPNHGAVPGINRPFLGEQDPHMMQAMSRPLNEKNTVTENNGRFSKTLYLNNPQKHQVLNRALATDLERFVDIATNALHTKLVVLTAAQSGRTDAFCGGLDFHTLQHDLSLADASRKKAQTILEERATLEASSKEDTPLIGTKDDKLAKLDAAYHNLMEEASRYEERSDLTVRTNAALMWRIFTAPRPLMTLINGTCRGTGCGVALLSKYSSLRDSSEFVFDGPNRGITPFGGLTHLLARNETALKFPGLAEFVMLTGTSLFAGDVLRLGWSDLFSTVAGVDYHIKEWFDSTEHMHNDAIAWQLGHLLESLFQMKEHHSTALERCAITPERARWIEDAFADQPSVEAVLQTLSQMEALPTSDPHNNSTAATQIPFSLSSVSKGVSKLRDQGLGYSLAPWDITPLHDAPSEPTPAANVFTSYVLERRGNVHTVVHTDRNKLRKWREQRYAEYEAHQNVQRSLHRRQVYVRLEGCDGKIVDFEYQFDKQGCVEALSAAQRCDDLVAGSAMLAQLKAKALEALGLASDRDVALGWYMPTLDTCPIHHDEDLFQVLINDPGVEDPSKFTNHPPVYFIMKRRTLHFSEWAFAVKHQLLLQSPFALKASFALLQEVRGDARLQAAEEAGNSNALLSVSDSLAAEYRFLTRTLRRPDFFAVGSLTERNEVFWNKQAEALETNIHLKENPVRPVRTFDQVFEKDVEIDGHHFSVRPRWFPRTLSEVDPQDIAKLALPLSFETERVTELDVPTYTAKRRRFNGMVQDVGVEIVAGLGEVDSAGAARVPSLKSNATVPENVDFYRMARHPWLDTATSWRQDGFTEGSLEYFHAKYDEAQQQLHDQASQQQRRSSEYWPTKDASEGVAPSEAEEAALLQDRYYDVLAEADKQVDQWARELRQKAEQGTLSRRTEVATAQEKIFDDQYYRWFIQPGLHPNPSGILAGKGRGRGAAGAESSENAEIASELDKLKTSDASQQQLVEAMFNMGEIDVAATAAESAFVGDVELDPEETTE